MHHQVRAPEKRILQTRRSKRTIDNEIGPSRMGLLGVFHNIVRRPVRIHRSLQMNHVSGLQIFCRTIEVQFLQAGKPREDSDYTMTTMVRLANGNPSGIEKR